MLRNVGHHEIIYKIICIIELETPVVFIIYNCIIQLYSLPSLSLRLRTKKPPDAPVIVKFNFRTVLIPVQD